VATIQQYVSTGGGRGLVRPGEAFRFRGQPTSASAMGVLEQKGLLVSPLSAAGVSVASWATRLFVDDCCSPGRRRPSPGAVNCLLMSLNGRHWNDLDFIGRPAAVLREFMMKQMRSGIGRVRGLEWGWWRRELWWCIWVRETETWKWPAASCGAEPERSGNCLPRALGDDAARDRCILHRWQRLPRQLQPVPGWCSSWSQPSLAAGRMGGADGLGLGGLVGQPEFQPAPGSLRQLDSAWWKKTPRKLLRSDVSGSRRESAS